MSFRMEQRLRLSSEPVVLKYDQNGNLVEDLRNDVSSIGYNAFNELPVSITNANGQKNYRYNAQGKRIVKEITANDVEYYMDGVIVDEQGNVKSYALPEGYAEPNLPLEKADYFYVITDWLGTTRSVINENGVQLNAVDHYPFGLRLPDRNAYNSGQEGYRYSREFRFVFNNGQFFLNSIKMGSYNQDRGKEMETTEEINPPISLKEFDILSYLENE